MRENIIKIMFVFGIFLCELCGIRGGYVCFLGHVTLGYK